MFSYFTMENHLFQEQRFEFCNEKFKRNQPASFLKSYIIIIINIIIIIIILFICPYNYINVFSQPTDRELFEAGEKEKRNKIVSFLIL